MALASIRPFLVRGIERQISSATSAYAATSRPAFSILALFGPDGLAKRGLFVGVKRTSIQGAPTSGNDPRRSAPGSWQRIGGESPPRGRSSQPPRPRVMHEVLLARAAVKRSQGRPRAKY